MYFLWVNAGVARKPFKALQGTNVYGSLVTKQSQTKPAIDSMQISVKLETK